jgi:peptidyl-prolyl cis-trans isomerase B (cyclophilin B)
MKSLYGLLLAIFAGLAPISGSTDETNTDKKGTGMVTVTMETSMGEITLELDSDKAPESTANFIAYAKSGHYDGTIFHRVIPGFMIQGGGFDVNMQTKPTNPPIKNEAANGLRNLNGTIAMARTNDPQSATSQFFINIADNAFLDHKSPSPQGWGYAVFGKVTDGMGPVMAIENVPTGNKGGHENVPLEPIVINKVTVAE